MEKLKTELKEAIKKTNKLLQEHKDEFPEYWFFEGQISTLHSVLNQINKQNEKN